MTVIKGKVRPDGDFPKETFGYIANRNSAHNWRTPLSSRNEANKTVEVAKNDKKTYRLRVARYELVEVTEIECIGERPNG